MASRRYFLDPLYGEIYLPDYVWAVTRAPEVQRLREVRMCNINSVSLVGAASVNRYEHAIGTSHLARVNMEAWPFGVSEEQAWVFVLAALLHDIGTAGFGHSVEYVLGAEGFEHEDVFEIVCRPPGEDVGFQYRRATWEPVFFGRQRELRTLLSEDVLQEIDRLAKGEGELGPLISGSMDLDNIDNVFRLAYHMGVWRGSATPLELAEAVHVEEGRLKVKESDVAGIEEWLAVRGELYRRLLLNADEFSAKCMLERALEIAQDKEPGIVRWNYVDYGLMWELRRVEGEVKELVDRIMLGRLFGCLGLFVIKDLSVAHTLSRRAYRRSLEEKATERLRALPYVKYKNAMVAMHVIMDKGKTSRELRVRVGRIGEQIFGVDTEQLLVGVFLMNEDFNVFSLDSEELARDGAVEAVHEVVQCASPAPVEYLEPYSERGEEARFWG